MAFDQTKYDIALNPQADSTRGYRINGYQKSEFSPFIPRLSSGDQKETDFDVLKTMTFNRFAGGSLARFFADEETQYAIEGKYPIYGDGVLFQANHASQSTIFVMVRPYVLARCSNKWHTFVAITTTTGGLAQRIYGIDSAGTVTSFTLPTVLSNGTYTIKDMVVWKNSLIITAHDGSSAGKLFRMTGYNTSIVEIGSQTTIYFDKMCVWRDALYGTAGPATGNATNKTLYKYTGDLSTPAVQQLAEVPTNTEDLNARLLVFNGRLLLSRYDGLWAWDNTSLTTIEDTVNQPNDRNFRFPVVLRGFLYYFMPDGFYRYNGSTIEKLYDIIDIGFPNDMSVGKNRIWMTFANDPYSSSSRYDKAMGYDYASGTNFDGRVMAFDGKGLFTYARVNTQIRSGSPAVANEGMIDKVIYSATNDKLYVSSFADPSSNQWTINTNERSLTAGGSGVASWQIVTPALDNDFPMVQKALANIELVLDGTPAADDTVNIDYRISGFDGSTGWSSLGTVKLQTRLKLDVIKTLAGGVTYKKIQFRISPNTTSSVAAGIEKIVIRYLLQPVMKYQWAFTILGYGDDPLEPLMLKDGTEETAAVSELRGNIYKCRLSVQPVLFIDVDYCYLNGAINSSVATLALDTVSLLKDSGYIMIDNEIIYFDKSTGNNLTIARGCFGTAAASHSDDAIVFMVYPVIIRQLQNERIDLTDRTTDEQTNAVVSSVVDKNKPSMQTLLLQEV